MEDEEYLRANAKRLYEQYESLQYSDQLNSNQQNYYDDTNFERNLNYQISSHSSISSESQNDGLKSSENESESSLESKEISINNSILSESKSDNVIDKDEDDESNNYSDYNNHPFNIPTDNWTGIQQNKSVLLETIRGINEEIDKILYNLDDFVGSLNVSRLNTLDNGDLNESKFSFSIQKTILTQIEDSENEF